MVINHRPGSPLQAIIYVASMLRSILALHDLINNKIENKEAEAKKGPPPRVQYFVQLKTESATVLTIFCLLKQQRLKW